MTRSDEGEEHDWGEIEKARQNMLRLRAEAIEAERRYDRLYDAAHRAWLKNIKDIEAKASTR